MIIRVVRTSLTVTQIRNWLRGRHGSSRLRVLRPNTMNLVGGFWLAFCGVPVGCTLLRGVVVNGRGFRALWSSLCGGNFCVYRMIDRGTSRGESRVLQFAMMIGVVVSLAMVSSVYVLGFQTNSEPAPVVAGSDVVVSGGEAVSVEVSYLSGERVSFASVAVVVEAECRSGVKSVRITELPLEGSDGVPESGSRGEPIVRDLSGVSMDSWVAGSPLRVVLDGDRCDLGSGDAVTVRVVHQPSNSILLEGSDSL